MSHPKHDLDEKQLAHDDHHVYQVCAININSPETKNTTIGGKIIICFYFIFFITFTLQLLEKDVVAGVALSLPLYGPSFFFAHRVGSFSIPAARRLPSNVASPRSRASRYFMSMQDTTAPAIRVYSYVCTRWDLNPRN